MWVIARPAGGERNVLNTQVIDGKPATAVARLSEGHWIVVSKQITEAEHAKLDGPLTLTKEGLSRLGEISTLLIAAAILAMAAALGSSMWQRRASLAGLRLAGVRPPRLRRVLLTEATLMLCAGCVTGALAGVYGQAIIDDYLKHVTGFPVADLTTSVRPVEILVLVIAIALVVVAVPGWVASRVSPTLALDD
jgi:putative ABC transport system permease protein